MRGAIFFFCSLLSAISYITGWSSFWQHPRQLRLFIPLLCVFLWMYRLISVVIFSWTGNGQEWTWCCSRMDIRVCVFSLSVFFVVVCTIFICTVFLWAPEHCVTTGWIFEISLCENSIQFNSIQYSNTYASNHWALILVSRVLVSVCLFFLVIELQYHYSSGGLSLFDYLPVAAPRRLPEATVVAPWKFSYIT